MEYSGFESPEFIKMSDDFDKTVKFLWNRSAQSFYGKIKRSGKSMDTPLIGQKELFEMDIGDLLDSHEDLVVKNIEKNNYFMQHGPAKDDARWLKIKESVLPINKRFEDKLGKILSAWIVEE